GDQQLSVFVERQHGSVPGDHATFHSRTRIGKTGQSRHAGGHRARKFIEERRRHQERWTVLIRDHHPGYISWEQYERNLRTMEANASQLQSASPAWNLPTQAGASPARY